ncbi:MAG: SUMF1/EgtB/PvdO family nonheme iron enzyme [Planctomycetota bacterium]
MSEGIMAPVMHQAFGPPGPCVPKATNPGILLATVALLVCRDPMVSAEFRHALVIGQSNYKSGPVKAGSLNASAVAGALVSRGFKVTKAENLATIKDLDEAVKSFAQGVPTGATALVYYSGKVAPAPVNPAMKDARNQTALVALDGSPQLVSVFLRPVVVPSFAPYGNGFQGIQSGSRINLMIIDAPRAEPHKSAPGAPHADPPPDTLLLFRHGTDGDAVLDPPVLSPLARRLVDGLNGPKSLDLVISGLSTDMASTLAGGELRRLASAPSRAASPPAALVAGRVPGEEWVDASGMVFCWCPPGRFIIGSPAGEPGRQPDETQAAVSFASGFWMAKHELSYRESVFLGGGAYLSTGDHKLHPLNLIRMDHVAKIIAAANAKAPAGWEYGLPTEAEWEYAARAGTTTAYSFGANPADLARHGNFADQSLRNGDCFGEHARTHKSRMETPIHFGDRQTGLFSYAHASWNDSSPSIARVGTYLPNAWGLCDMHGNISEATSTIYDATRLAPVVPPQGRAAWSGRPENQKYALGSVCKGGSWASVHGSCRSAFRGWSSVTDNIVGVRLVLRGRDSIADVPPNRWTTLVASSFSTTSGAETRREPDGTLLVTGKPFAGETYSINCPVPAGIEPIALRIELLADPSLPRGGPGRQLNSGSFSIAEISLGASRGGAAAPVEVLDARSDFPAPQQASIRNLADGDAETAWGAAGDGKNHELVLTIAPRSRTGHDGALWRPAAVNSGSVKSLSIGIRHAEVPGQAPATIGKFRVSVLHETPAAANGEARP